MLIAKKMLWRTPPGKFQADTAQKNSIKSCQKKIIAIKTLRQNLFRIN
jgi:hypothetical protein